MKKHFYFWLKAGISLFFGFSILHAAEKKCDDVEIDEAESYWSKATIVNTFTPLKKSSKIIAFSHSPKGCVIFFTITNPTENKILAMGNSNLSSSILPGEHPRAITSLLTSPTGKFILSASQHKVLKIGVHYLDKKQNIEKPNAKWLMMETIPFRYKADEEDLFASDLVGPILSWTLNNSADLLFMSVESRPKEIGVWYSPKWSRESRPQKIDALTDHKGRINQIQFSDSENKLVSIGDGSSLLVYNIRKSLKNPKKPFDIELLQRIDFVEGLRMKCLALSKDIDNTLYLGGFVNPNKKINLPNYIKGRGNKGCGIILKIKLRKWLESTDGLTKKNKAIIDNDFEETYNKGFSIDIRQLLSNKFCEGYRLPSLAQGYPKNFHITPCRNNLLGTMSNSAYVFTCALNKGLFNPYFLPTQGAKPNHIIGGNGAMITVSDDSIDKWMLQYNDNLQPIFSFKLSQPLDAFYISGNMLFFTSQNTLYVSSIKIQQKKNILIKEVEYQEAHIIRDILYAKEKLYVALGHHIHIYENFMGGNPQVTQLDTTPHSSPISSLTFHPTKEVLYAADFKGNIGCYDFSTQPEIKKKKEKKKPQKKTKTNFFKKKKKKENDETKEESKEDDQEIMKKESHENSDSYDVFKTYENSKNEDLELVNFGDLPDKNEEVGKKKKEAPKVERKTKLLEVLPKKKLYANTKYPYRYKVAAFGRFSSKKASPIYTLMQFNFKNQHYLFAGKKNGVDIFLIKSPQKLALFSSFEEKTIGSALTLQQALKSSFFLLGAEKGIFVCQMTNKSFLFLGRKFDSTNTWVNHFVPTSNQNECIAFGNQAIETFKLSQVTGKVKNPSTQNLIQQNGICGGDLYANNYLICGAGTRVGVYHTHHNQQKEKPLNVSLENFHNSAPPNPQDDYTNYAYQGALLLPQTPHGIAYLNGWIAIAGDHGKVTLWYPKEESPNPELSAFTTLPKVHNNRILALTSNETDLLCAIDKGGIIIYKPFSFRMEYHYIPTGNNKTLTKKKKSNPEPVQCAIFHNYQPILFTLSQKGTLLTWDLTTLQTPKVLYQYNLHQSALGSEHFLLYHNEENALYCLNEKGSGAYLKIGKKKIEKSYALSIWEEAPKNFAITSYILAEDHLCFATTDGQLARWQVKFKNALIGDDDDEMTPLAYQQYISKGDKLCIYKTQNEKKAIVLTKKSPLIVWDFTEEDKIHHMPSPLYKQKVELDEETNMVVSSQKGISLSTPVKVKYGLVDDEAIYLIIQEEKMNGRSKVHVWEHAVEDPQKNTYEESYDNAYPILGDTGTLDPV